MIQRIFKTLICYTVELLIVITILFFVIGISGWGFIFIDYLIDLGLLTKELPVIR